MIGSGVSLLLWLLAAPLFDQIEGNSTVPSSKARDGRDGAKGDKGVAGPIGSRGVKGDKGVAGPIGSGGAKGEKGVAGPCVVWRCRHWPQKLEAVCVEG
ncbi:hypothetical protein OS493_010978 [Desmophyllum pertusum]|uniref:Glycine-rich protein n=1 Tax=Desmophyllum pertusum TaxID=174260 RepID=A0A9X0CZM1_9CNID|nr:hypothetical protein OS493_010978 [Desmophyllum pertusum]